jgi:Holliday junction resolvase RusA-like endonuclease
MSELFLCEQDENILISPSIPEPECYKTKWFYVPIKINSNHRPRMSKKGLAISDKEYKKFKDLLTFIFKGKKIKIEGSELIHIQIPKADYFGLEVIAYFPPHKKENVPPSKKKHKERMRRDPDCSNIIKGIEDALQYAHVLKDDNLISDLIVRERYNIETKTYYFKFRLFGYKTLK